MCLILVAWQAHAKIPLIVAANRDEFHARPAAPAGFWLDHPEILAGRDLEAMGTWLGISRAGRFAAVTNYRGGRDPGAAESRGRLVTRFLLNSQDPESYLSDLSLKKSSYSGFNLLVADSNALWWLSNRDSGPRRLDPGIHALGNLLLDTPEVTVPKTHFAASIASNPSIETLFGVLATAKIVAPEYGTRCSSVLRAHGDGRTDFAERPFDPAGADAATLRFELRRPN